MYSLYFRIEGETPFNNSSIIFLSSFSFLIKIKNFNKEKIRQCNNICNKI